MPTSLPSLAIPSSDFNIESTPPSPLSLPLPPSQGLDQELDKIQQQQKSNKLFIQKLYYKRSRDLLSSQVKAVSFLTHVLRHLSGGSDVMK